MGLKRWETAQISKNHLALSLKPMLIFFFLTEFWVLKDHIKKMKRTLIMVCRREISLGIKDKEEHVQPVCSI